MNVEAMLKLADVIEIIDGHYRQNTWRDELYGDEDPFPVDEVLSLIGISPKKYEKADWCDTTGCLAGWQAVIADPGFKFRNGLINEFILARLHPKKKRTPWTINDFAQATLDLTDSEAHALFAASWAPLWLVHDVEDVDSGHVRPDDYWDCLDSVRKAQYVAQALRQYANDERSILAGNW